MRIIKRVVIVVLAACAGGVLAHSAEEHMESAEKPDCRALEGMDLSKRDKSDPVVQAMKKKCMKQLHRGEDGKEVQSEKRETEMSPNNDSNADNQKEGSQR